MVARILSLILTEELFVPNHQVLDVGLISMRQL